MGKIKLVKKRFLFLLIIGIILVMGTSSMSTSCAASTVSVNTTGNDANNGTASNPYQTISTGISKVNNKGAVNLSKGTFNLNNNVNHTDFGITINKNVTIQGAGSNQTIIDAKGINFIFSINNSKVIIRDLTLKDGYSQSGGSIKTSLGSNVTLINCIIINNIATGFGGAIYNSGKMNITGCTLANNTVTNGYGSAVYNHNGTAEIHYNSIFGNSGNAVYSDGGTVNAQNNWWGTNDNPGTELEDFSDLSNWTKSSASTSVVTINGDKGIKVVGNNGSYPGIKKNVHYNFNGVAPNLQLWLYLSDLNCTTLYNPQDLIDIGVELFTASNNKYFEGFLIQSQLHNGINYIVIPQSQLVPYGGVTWNDTITGISFRLFYEPGASMNATFMELKKNIDGVPRMVLSFDDGYTSVFTTAFPIMQQYGIKGTIYLNSAYVGDNGRLTLDQLHQLYNAGWTIANHTPSHTDLTTLTSVADIKTVIQQGIDWLLANGFTRGAYDFANPFGKYNDMVLEALKECGVQTDRTVMLGMTSIPADNLLEIGQEGPNGDGYPNGGDYTTLTMADKFVDDTIQNKVSTFVMMHMITDTPQSGIEWATSDFSNWIAYIAQSGIETKTVDQWYNDVSGLTFGTVNYNPWIVMNEAANPNSLKTSGTSILTADFTHNSNGEDISGLGNIPNGLVVNFSSDPLGTVNSTSSTTLNGKSTTSYKAGTTVGNSNVSARANNQIVSTSINITSGTVLAVVSTDPANGALNVAGNKVMTIIFNVPIKAGSAYSSISMLNTYENAAKDIITTISGNTLTITPTYNWLQFVKYSITLPVNSIADLEGNSLTALFTSFFTCNNAVDTVPPTIVNTDPVNNANNVPTNKVINISFNEPIQAGTAYNNIKIVNSSTNTAQNIIKTITNNILTITSPNAWLLGITYTVTIPLNSITDLTGNNLTNSFTSNFTINTSTDNTPPAITSSDPANNTSASPTKIMTITFSEPIQAGSAYSSISVLNTNENASKDIIASISGNTLTITPTYNWLQFVKYTLTIPANSITDLAGNNLVANYTTSFTCSSI